MDKSDRKAALSAYKERKPTFGIFAVRCAAANSVWVGGSRTPEGQRNKIWFTLRLGSAMNKAMQAAWTAHGEDAFTFEQLEIVEEEDGPAYLRDGALKDSIAAWRTKLDALPA